jgi:hypothetical protein
MNETIDRSHFTPQGWHTVTPRIVVHEAQLLVEFLKYVFRATGEYRPDAPTVLSIGDSIIMISDAGIRDPAPRSCMYMSTTLMRHIGAPSKLAPAP